MPSSILVTRAKLRPILAAIEKIVKRAEKRGEVSPDTAALVRRSLSQAHAAIDQRFSAARDAITPPNILAAE